MSAGGDDERELAELFAETARALEAEPTPRATLNRIARATVRTVPGCEHAGVMLVDRHGHISTQAASDELPEKVDAIQYQVGTGPCLRTIRQHESYLIDDLAADARWGPFGARAASETGVRSMLSFLLSAGEDTLGALNLYSRVPRAFDDRAHSVGAILAAHAAIALNASLNQDKARNLDRALATSREIGMAVGILMAHRRCGQEEAFLALRNASNRLNLKLREVAVRVVEAGEIIDEATRPRA